MSKILLQTCSKKTWKFPRLRMMMMEVMLPYTTKFELPIAMLEAASQASIICLKVLLIQTKAKLQHFQMLGKYMVVLSLIMLYTWQCFHYFKHSWFDAYWQHWDEQSLAFCLYCVCGSRFSWGAEFKRCEENIIIIKSV